MLIYIAILSPGLLLFCGLVLDVGQLEYRRLQMQSASDAAAIGAALEVERGTGFYVRVGKADAGFNGFTDGSNNAAVNVSMVPTYGSYNGFNDAVQTTITQPQPLLFLGMLGTTTSTVSTRSSALIAPCAYITSAAGLVNPSLSLTGSTTVSATCPWYVNSSAQLASAAKFSSLAENMVGSAGQSSWSGSVNPAPRYNVATSADPLSAVVMPTPGSCAYSNVTASRRR